MKKFNGLLLVIFIALAVILNYIPHFSYSYPLHVDEYVHWQYANYLSNDSPLYFGQVYGVNLESGFHFLLATLNSFGIDYLFIFQYFSILITIILCIFIFVLTRKIWGERAGLFSVLFVALLQSSVAILGPVFVVPMALGLVLILAGLFFIKINSNSWFLILSCLLILHPPSALAFLLLINIEFLINRKHYLKNILLQAIAGLIALPLYLDIFLAKGFTTINSLSFTTIIPPLFIPRFLGWLVTIIVLIGIYYSLTRKEYSFTLYSLALLIFTLIFYQFRTELFIPYARVLMYLFIVFGVLFGIGCDKICEIGRVLRIRNLIVIILVIVILIFALPAKIESNNYFYHIIDDKDYDSFNWIKEDLPVGIAVVDPWKANAFTPIAEHPVYSRITQGPNDFYEARNQEINKFFAENCSNQAFLKQNNISIIYGNCTSTNLKEVYPHVYLVR